MLRYLKSASGIPLMELDDEGQITSPSLTGAVTTTVQHKKVMEQLSPHRSDEGVFFLVQYTRHHDLEESTVYMTARTLARLLNGWHLGEVLPRQKGGE